MANNVIKRVWNQNRMVAIEDLKGMTFQAESGGHTFQISGVDDAGNTVALSGSVAGVFLRPDNTDVAITGSASGGVVSVTLPANCYDVPGRFGLTVFVTANGQKTAVYAAMGTVSRTSSGTVSPGTTSDVVDLINRINAAVATIPASWTGLMADIAPTYSDAAVYPVGAYVYYNGDLYRCTTAITTAESWTAGHWTQAVLGNDVSDLKSAISDTDDTFSDFLESEIGKTTYVFTYEDGKAWNTSESPVTLQTPNNTVWKFCKIPCASGDVFHVNINAGGSNYRPWAFVDASMELLSKASVNVVDTDITAPENAAYLLCNVRISPEFSTGVHKVTKGINSKQDKLTFDSKPIKNSNNPVTSNGIFNALADIAESYYQWLDDKAVATNGETVGDPVDASGRRCAVIDLTGVECVTLLNATGSTTYRPWCFIDDSGNKISICSISGEATRRLYKPTGATKLVINTTLVAQTKLYIGLYVDNVALLDISSDIRHYGCLEKYMSNGGWGTSGYLNRQYRTFTKPDLVLDFDATIRCTEDYQFAVIYDDNGTAKDTGWTRVFNVKSGTAFSVVTRKATEDTSSIADVHEFAMNVTVEKTINPLSMPVFVTDKARIVMHRGYMADETNIPENSIPAFNKAGEIGAWAIETDIQETSDGYYVLMHDSTVDRTTTGTGSISSMTYEQTQELYLIGGDGTLKIPSFSDFLVACKKWNMVGMIEIKSILRGKTSMKEIIDIVHEYGLDDRVMFIFNSETDMIYYSVLDFTAPMSFNVGSSDDYESAITTALKYPRCGIAYKSGSEMTSTITKKCHAHNIFVNTWTSSSWDAQSVYFERGCDMVTSNSNAVRPAPTT